MRPAGLHHLNFPAHTAYTVAWTALQASSQLRPRRKARILQLADPPPAAAPTHRAFTVLCYETKPHRISISTKTTTTTIAMSNSISSSSSSTPQFLHALKQDFQSLISTLRPWSAFFDLTSLNLPPSIADASTRVTQNLTHFLSNYSLLFAVCLLLPLIPHPLSLLALLATFLAWVSLYFSRKGPVTVFGYHVADSVLLVALIAATVAVLAWSGVWVRLLVAGGVGAGIIGLHALLRSTDDLVADDLEASPYRDLLSDDEEQSRGLEL